MKIKSANLHYLIIVAFIAFIFPFQQVIISLFIGFWFLIVLFQKNKIKLFIYNSDKLSKYILLFQLLLFVLISVSYFFSTDKKTALEIIEMRLSLFVFPFLFILSRQKLKFNRKFILKSFIYGNIIAIIVCFILALNNSITLSEGNFIFDPLDIHKVSFFRYSHFSFFMHPAFFGMYLNFSIVIILCFIDSIKQKTLKNSFLYYLAIALFIVVIYLLSSKAAIITLIFIFAWRTITIFRNNKNFILKILLIILLISITFSASQNMRFKKLLNQIELTLTTKDIAKNVPSRILIWENSLELIKENFWFGTSPGDAQAHIDKNYLKNNKFIPKEGQVYNSHNQYLQTFVESGFIGLLLLILIFGGGFVIAYKRKEILFSMFIFIVLLNFFFDSILTGFAGIVFIFYFFNLFVFVNKKLP